MGFDLESFVSGITSSRFVSGTLGNPIWSSFIVVGILMIIIYWVFYEPLTDSIEEAGLEDEYSFWKLWIRTGIYMLVAVMGLFFLHYKQLSYDFEKQGEEKFLSRTVESTLVTEPKLGMAEPIILPNVAQPAHLGQAQIFLVNTEPTKSPAQIAAQNSNLASVSNVFKSSI